MPGDRAHSVVLCWGMRLKEAKEAEAGGRLSEEDGNFLRLFSRCVRLLDKKKKRRVASVCAVVYVSCRTHGCADFVCLARTDGEWMVVVFVVCLTLAV